MLNPRYLRPSAVRTTLAATILLATQGPSGSPEEKAAFNGEWIFVEDRTEGRSLEQLNPPMSSRFRLKVEDSVVILESGHGSGLTNVRIPLDGTPTDIPGSSPGAYARYRASWKDGVLAYEVDFVRAAGEAPTGLIQREFRMIPEGMIVRSNLMLTAGVWSVGLYRHPEDIPMPTPAKAVIGDLAWLSGAWVGTRGTGGTISMEERWSPPKGGAMLGISRTVSREKMTAFEYLRIVERDGGLVYIAQPGGAPATEFIMSEISSQRAVFENPRHDYPRRIVYELTSEGGLAASIGQLKGGSPRKFEFRRETSE